MIYKVGCVLDCINVRNVASMEYFAGVKIHAEHMLLLSVKLTFRTAPPKVIGP